MRRANHPGPESRNEPRRRLFRTATLGWAIIICWLAFQPSTAVESGLPWDKANHAAAFLVLTLLAGRGWPALSRVAVVLAMLAAGVGIELVQGLPWIGRHAETWDVLADAVGVAAGLGLLAWLERARYPLRE
jgi:VanZ family protein